MAQDEECVLSVTQASAEETKKGSRRKPQICVERRGDCGVPQTDTGNHFWVLNSILHWRISTTDCLSRCARPLIFP